MSGWSAHTTSNLKQVTDTKLVAPLRLTIEVAPQSTVNVYAAKADCTFLRVDTKVSDVLDIEYAITWLEIEFASPQARQFETFEHEDSRDRQVYIPSKQSMNVDDKFTAKSSKHTERHRIRVKGVEPIEISGVGRCAIQYVAHKRKGILGGLPILNRIKKWLSAHCMHDFSIEMSRGTNSSGKTVLEYDLVLGEPK